MSPPVQGLSRENRNEWEEYFPSDNRIIQRIVVGFLDHGPFCNPQQRPPSMHSHDDEIKNDKLMVFSPRPVLLHEKSHPLWGFRGSVIESDRTGIFPFNWMIKSLRERRIGYVPPTIEEYARTDYDSLVFAITRTLAGKCVRSCHWLLEHDCSGGQGGGRCIFPPFHKGLCLCEPCRSHIGHRMGQNTARADGNTFLDEFHDTVSCNEQWRKKYPSIYDKAENISTAYSKKASRIIRQAGKP